MQLLITLFIALASGFLLYKLKVPGGMMVGAILGAAIYNILTDSAVFPAEAKFLAQVIAGAFIGSGMNRSDLVRLPKLIKPIFILLLNLIVINIVLGILIWKISDLDLLTSLMSVVPGGMSDIPLIAADMGANTGVVATLQFVRMSVGVGLFPILIQKLDTKLSHENPKVPEENKKSSRMKINREYNYRHLSITLCVALVGGYIGKKSGVPAGTLAFSMISVLILKLTTGVGNLPIELKRLAQVLSGAYIGVGIRASDIAIVKTLLLPVLLIILFYLLNCLWTGFVLNKRCNFERKEALLAATPAGASDMALISSDIGVDSVDLIVMQIIRMIVVIAVFPQIISLVVNILQ